MRRQTASPYLLLPLLFCLVLPVAARGSELEPQSGKAEMTFRLPDLHDQEHSLPDYRGTVVLVNFWASWCPPCVQEMPDLARLQQRLADRRFQVLALNVGEKKYRVRKFVNLIGFHLPVLLDTTSEIFDTWHVKTLPTTFLIAADGRVRYRALGNPDWNGGPSARYRHRGQLMKIPIRLIAGTSLLSALLLPGLATADEASQREQVETLFRLTQMEKKIQESVDSVVRLELQQNPQLQNDRKALEDFLQKYIGWDALKDDITATYMRAFSEQELKEMNAFYITPTGQKVITVVPELVQQRNRLAMERLQQHIGELRKMIQQKPAP